MTFADVMHNLIDQGKWHTEDERTAAHQAVVAEFPDAEHAIVPLVDPTSNPVVAPPVVAPQTDDTGGVSTAASATVPPEIDEADPTGPANADAPKSTPDIVNDLDASVIPIIAPLAAVLDDSTIEAAKAQIAELQAQVDAATAPVTDAPSEG